MNICGWHVKVFKDLFIIKLDKSFYKLELYALQEEWHYFDCIKFDMKKEKIRAFYIHK